MELLDNLKNKPANKFFFFGLFLLGIALFFGLTGALQYLVPGLFKENLSFEKVRPLHVTSVSYTHLDVYKRQVPFLSKITDVPMANLATKAILGQKLKDLGYQNGLVPEKEGIYVKVPVFSFSKLTRVDVSCLLYTSRCV